MSPQRADHHEHGDPATAWRLFGDEPAPARSAAGRRRGQPGASHRDAPARLLRSPRRARLL